MKGLVILLPLICFLAISSAQEELEIEFPDELSFDEFAENSVFSTKILSELAEELEKTHTSNTRVQDSTVAVVNDYVDKLITNLNNFTSNKGLNELVLPDISEYIEYKPALSLITFTGLLNLTDGELSGLSSIERKGDVKITYGDKDLSILVPVGIKSLSIKYNYVAKIMQLGPSGTITGKVTETSFTFGLSYNISGHRAALDTFEVNKIGSITLNFSGHILSDWLATLVTNIALPFFKRIIQKVLESNVNSILESVIDIINSALEKIYP